MIQIIIEIPHEVSWVQTPKMILGNYIHSDDRVRRLECDRMMGYCDTEIIVEEYDDTTLYTIKATYNDSEAEMLTRLVL